MKLLPKVWYATGGADSGTSHHHHVTQATQLHHSAHSLKSSKRCQATSWALTNISACFRWPSFPEMIRKMCHFSCRFILVTFAITITKGSTISHRANEACSSLTLIRLRSSSRTVSDALLCWEEDWADSWELMELRVTLLNPGWVLRLSRLIFALLMPATAHTYRYNVTSHYTTVLLNSRIWLVNSSFAGTCKTDVPHNLRSLQHQCFVTVSKS